MCLCVFGFRHEHGVLCLRNCLWNKRSIPITDWMRRERSVYAHVIMADTITSESCVKSFSYQFPFPLRYVSLFAPIEYEQWTHKLHFDMTVSMYLSLSSSLSWGVFVHYECFALHCVYHVPFSDSQHIHICQTCLLIRPFVCARTFARTHIIQFKWSQMWIEQGFKPLFVCKYKFKLCKLYLHWFSFQTTIEHKGTASKLCATIHSIMHTWKIYKNGFKFILIWKKNTN